MIYYAVIDTNVLVSALMSKHITSATYRVLEKILSQEVVPLYSKEILDEYNEVLRRKKFNIDEADVEDVLDMVQCGIKVNPSPTDEFMPDLTDKPFYEVVLEKRDDDAYLVTGNLKHFPRKPFIVTPAEFLDIIEKNN